MIRATPTESDLVAAIWIRRKRLFTGKMGWFTWLGIACALATGVLLIVLGPEYGIDVSTGYWLLGIYSWVWIVVGLIFLMTPIKVKRIFKRLRLAETSYTIDWDQEKLVTEDKHSKSSLPWNEFTSWFEDKQIFMIYRCGIIPRFIPKRILNEQQLQELRGILLHKIGPQGVTRK